jgi:Flp pilus assembly pilin Flp
MQLTKKVAIAALLDFVRREDGAHGAEHALLTGLIACTLVLGANWFWHDLSTLISEYSCNAQGGCGVLEISARPTPLEASPPADVMAVEAAPTLRHASDQDARRDAPRKH